MSSGDQKSLSKAYSETVSLPRSQEQPEVVTPNPANGATNGVKVCARCQAANRADAGRCGSCQSWLGGNKGALKHNIYAKTKPTDVLLTAEQLLTGIVSDKGGLDEMPTLLKDAVSKLRDVDILINLNKRTIIREGVEGPTGRRAHDRYLNCLDRYLRLVQVIGLERHAKRVDLARRLSGLDQ
jgi:hypothetical protein